METKKTYTDNFIYCGNNIYKNNYYGNPIYKIHFVYENYVYAELFTPADYKTIAFFNQLKYGTKVIISYHYDARAKRNIIDAYD